MSLTPESAAAMAGSGPRRAALLLHAMPTADRQWILGTLEPAERVRLEAMLEELRSLGIAPAPAFIEALVNSNDGPAAPFRPQDVDADVVHDVLRDEPDALIVRLLAPAPAAWRRAVIDEFDASRRNALRACVAGPSTAPQESPCRLDEELSRQLQARLGARMDEVAARRTRWSAWTRRLRKWSAAMRVVSSPRARTAS